MEDEIFASFNAHQFVDFSQREQDLDESLDAFFDADHESRDGSKFKRMSRDSRIQSEDAYYSPFSNSSFSPAMDNQDENPSTVGFKLRKSMSVGNLILFNEQDDREKYQPPLEEICENFQCLAVECNVKKNFQSLTVELNVEENFQSLIVERNVEEIPRQQNIPSNKSILNKNSNESLYGKGNQDHLNKLALPKRYGSVENLKQGNSVQKFVSLAEAVSQFQNRTPVRFRSKPNLHQPPFQPLSRTVPESPALQTKARSRPGRILSHAEQEQIDFENQQKFKIKANPVNKRMLQGPLKPVAPIERKHYTIPKPFNLSAAPPKKIVPEKKYEFHARPIPRSAEKPRRASETQRRDSRRELTKPITPSFMKNYKPPSYKLDAPPQTKEPTNHEHPRTLTKPEPFSFDQRDKMVQKKREKLIQRIREEERRAREFHAKPMPKSIYKKCTSTSSNLCSSESSSKLSSCSTETVPSKFKAREPFVLYKEPFVPTKAEKPPTLVKPFRLESEMRYQEREQFDRERRLKEEKLEALKKLREEEILKREQEEIARIRKETEYKAKPVRKYKEVVIQPSGKITEPVSPKFHSRESRRTKDKENIPNNE